MTRKDGVLLDHLKKGSTAFSSFHYCTILRVLYKSCEIFYHNSTLIVISTRFSCYLVTSFIRSLLNRSIPQLRVVLQISSHLMFSDFMGGLKGETPESLMFSLRGELQSQLPTASYNGGMHIEIGLNNVFTHFNTDS